MGMIDPKSEAQAEVKPNVKAAEVDSAAIKQKGSGRVGNHNKKFSVTIQLPEDVAERLPEWLSSERLMGEVAKAAAAVAATPARSRLVSRLFVIAVVVLAAELFVGALLLGYVAGGWFRTAPTEVATEPASPDAQAATSAEPAATTEPAASSAESAPPSSEPADASSEPAAGTEPDASAATPAPPAPAPAAPQAAAPPAPATVAPSARPAPSAFSPANRPPQVYRVQVGAFRQPINADQLVIRLREDGYQPVVRTVGGLRVVQIGSFTNRAAAERLVRELRAKRYDALVVP